MESTRLSEARNQGFSRVEHLLDLVGKNGQLVGVFRAQVGRSDNANGVDGNQDVAISWPNAAIDDVVRKTMIHGDHDPRTGNDFHSMAVREGRNLSGPGTATVQDKGTVNSDVFARSFIAREDRFDTVLAALNPGCTGVGEDLRSIGNGRARCAPDHTPAVDGSVLYCECALESRIKSRLATKCLGGRNLFCRNMSGSGASDELIGVVFIVDRGCHEETAGLLHGISIDAGNDCIFFRAFGCRFRVGRNVACA